MELHSETRQQPIIQLTREEARELELRLNVTSKGERWSHIGDILYDYSSSNKKGYILLTDKQYEFIGILLKKKSWEECNTL